MSVTDSNVTQSSQPTPGLGSNYSSTTSYVQIITTTIYSGTPYPTVSSSYGQHTKSPLPVGAIAGGAAGGVFLAVAAVVIWAWWGKCIQRRRDKERKEIIANLQVKENTRRNAQSGSYTRFPSSFSSSRHDRKVTFVPSAPASSQSSLKGVKEERKKIRSDPADGSERATTAPHRPVRPSPLGRNSSRVERAPLLVSPPRPEGPSQRSPIQSNSSSPVQPFLKRPLTHKVSAASSMSAYSTASGEERQKRVSTTLIMAALGHIDPRRSWLGNYLPLNAQRNRTNNDVEASRLSQMSAASAYSQTDDQLEEAVGYAYGGEEGPAPK